LLQLFGSNVEKKDEKNITITLSPDMLDKKRNKEDDFGMTEMLLSMTSALDLGDEKKHLGPAQKLKEKLDIIAEIPAGGKKSKGFFTKFYIPFFKQMRADSLTQTAAYIIYGSSTEEELKNWIRENKTSIDAFYSWLQNYAWVKNE
jgi:hypothetical protein